MTGAVIRQRQRQDTPIKHRVKQLSWREVEEGRNKKDIQGGSLGEKFICR